MLIFVGIYSCLNALPWAGQLRWRGVNLLKPGLLRLSPSSPIDVSMTVALDFSEAQPSRALPKKYIDFVNEKLKTVVFLFWSMACFFLEQQSWFSLGQVP